MAKNPVAAALSPPSDRPEADYFGNLVPNTPVPVGDPNRLGPDRAPPKGWGFGYYGNPQDREKGLFSALRQTYGRQPGDFYDAIATMDPTNPHYPTPEGSSLSGYLSSNPDALSWLTTYANNLRTGTQYQRPSFNAAPTQRNYLGQLL